MRWKCSQPRYCICGTVVLFRRVLPILPAILAPFIVLYVLSKYNVNSHFPMKIKVHLTDESYIREVLHQIDMPVIDNHTYAMNTYSNAVTTDDKEKLAIKKLEPYVRPGVQRLKKGSTKAQISAYREYLRNLDIMSVRVPRFLPQYKNPCWKEPYTQPAHCPFINIEQLRQITPRKYPTLRCLPYFYIIGQPKCGTTDIYRRLSKHPDVTLSESKEPYWLNRRRFFQQCSSLSTYTDYFHASAKVIESTSVRNLTTYQHFHHMVTGEGSVDIMWDNHIWHDLPRNRHCKEPCYTNADYIKHINPKAKIIVAFRNPIDRVYSDYMFEHIYLNYKPDKLDFHKRLVEEIYRFRRCLKNNSLRYCVYDSTLESALSAVRLLVGIYHVHLADWLRVFPRNQIHVIRFEDYIKDTRAGMEKLFDFMSLRKLSKEEMDSVMNLTNSTNKRPVSSRDHGDMNKDSRSILQQFYAPFNQKLAALLHDDRYLWKDNNMKHKQGKFTCIVFNLDMTRNENTKSYMSNVPPFT